MGNSFNPLTTPHFPSQSPFPWGGAVPEGESWALMSTHYRSLRVSYTGSLFLVSPPLKASLQRKPQLLAFLAATWLNKAN